MYFGTLFLDSQDNIPALNGCIYEMSPASSSTGSNANSVLVLVVTQSAYSYIVSVTDAFTTSGTGGVGTGVVSVGFADNSGRSRNTAIEIAGRPIV